MMKEGYKSNKSKLAAVDIIENMKFRWWLYGIHTLLDPVENVTMTSTSEDL